MKDLIILTVYNRPERMLENTLSALAGNALEGAKVLVVDDGSTRDYSGVDCGPLEVEWIKSDTVKARPDTYHIDGHNNPAYVNNLAISAAKERGAERVFFLSSDVMLPSHALTHARASVDTGAVFTPMVLDTATSSVWNNSGRPWPMMWFAGCRLEWAEDCGGFDEEFLKGMAFEDNDFMGRLCIHAGALDVHDGVVALHQSHPQTAYSDGNKGFKVSEQYCLKKWRGSVPWRTNGDPLVFFPIGKASSGATRFRVQPSLNMIASE